MLALIGLMLPATGHTAGSVFGSLANFDAVNDTGKDAYGFEIEIDDPSFDHTKIGSVFGLNRNFGVYGTLGVVRWGKAEIIDLPGIGVKVKYGGDIGSIFTPANGANGAPLYSTPGESCWPGANAGWKANPCDHFGITTYGSPASTKYSWLVVDPNTGNTLVPELLHIPAVTYVYTPPVVQPPQIPGPPPVIVVPAVVKPKIVAEAPPAVNPEDDQRWGEAFWVKSIKTSIKNPHDIDLGHLLRGDNGNPDLEVPEVEIEWEVFQKAPVADHAPGPKEVKEGRVELGDADKSIIMRYEFYKYANYEGAFDSDGMGEATCDRIAPHRCDTPFGDGSVNDLGPYIGQQIAGFNAVQAVPEPQTYAMMLAGLAGIGWLTARRRRS